MRHFEREALIWASELDTNSKILLLAINQYIGSNGTAWPSTETLAQDTSLSRSTVLRRIEFLEEKQILKIQRRYNQGMQTSSEYTINWSTLGVISITANPSIQQPVEPSIEGGVTETLPILLDFSLEEQEIRGVTVTLPGNQGCHGDTQGVSQRHSRGVTVTHRSDPSRTNPNRTNPITNQEDRGAGAPPLRGDFSECECEPVLREVEVLPTTQSTTAVLDSSSESAREGESSAPAARPKSKPRKRRKLPTASEVYPTLEHLDSFEKYWDWYCNACRKNGANPGSKVAAALEWRDVIEPDWGNYDRVRQGTVLWFKSNKSGIPHCCRFIAGSESHPEPYWQAALDRADEECMGRNGSEFAAEAGEGVAVSVQAQIVEILKQRNISGVLPDEWQQRTGLTLIGELDDRQSMEFLDYLKGLHGH